EEYASAENYFKEILSIYKKYYEENHIKVAQVFMNLGTIYFLKGDLDNAEVYLTKTLKVFEKHKHPDVYMVLEVLSELYLKKAEETQKQIQATDTELFKIQS